MVYRQRQFANSCSDRGGNFFELNAPIGTMRDDSDHRGPNVDIRGGRRQAQLAGGRASAAQ
jgi:hypothetical protein